MLSGKRISSGECSKSSAYIDLLCLHYCLHGIHCILTASRELQTEGRQNCGVYSVYFLPFVLECCSVIIIIIPIIFIISNIPPAGSEARLSATAEIWLSLQWLQFTGIFQRFHDRSSYQQPIIAPHIQSRDRSAGRPWLRRQGVTQLYYQPAVWISNIFPGNSP